MRNSEYVIKEDISLQDMEHPQIDVYLALMLKVKVSIINYNLT